jgi:predicted RNA-binding Zn ribbon-like protein
MVYLVLTVRSVDWAGPSVKALGILEVTMPTSTYKPRLDEPRPIALVNTIWTDHGGIHDALGQTAGVQLWVRAVGERMNLAPLLGNNEAVSVTEARRLVDLRDAVRRLAAEHTHDPRSLGQSPVPDQTTAISIVNASAAMSSVRPELLLDGPEPRSRDIWDSGSSVDALIAVIAREAIDLITSPQWQLLRPCVAPGCAYYFVKERFRREWCSAVCGNRARVARHAQRRRITQSSKPALDKQVP